MNTQFENNWNLSLVWPCLMRCCCPHGASSRCTAWPCFSSRLPGYVCCLDGLPSPSLWAGGLFWTLRALELKWSLFLSALSYHCLIISASHLFLSCSPIVQAARSCQQFSFRCGKARLSYSSYRGQVKVVVDLHERDVELGDLKDAGGLVGGRVQLLQLELPLQALHCVQSCCLVLLPHQKTRLWREEKEVVTSSNSCSHLDQERPSPRRNWWRRG